MLAELAEYINHYFRHGNYIYKGGRGEVIV